jgi:transcriptional regulator with XRE-family HTH domain
MAAWALVMEARREAGLTQRQLAERAGTSQAAVARIERGRQSPSLDTLQRLLRSCGLELRLEVAPRDEQTERLIDATLAMSPEERLRAVEEVTRFTALARPA